MVFAESGGAVVSIAGWITRAPSVVMRASMIAVAIAPIWTQSVGAAAGDAAQGVPVYKANCAACHGSAGLGDGPVAAALNPAPANFASDASRKKGEAELLAIIQNGVPNTSMPAYENTLSEPQIQDVLAHVLTLRSPKPGPPPAIAAGVLRQPAPRAAAAAPAASVRPESGAEAYGNSCVFCHDTNTGPTLRGRKLAPNYVQFIVRNGSAAMPAFRPSEIDDPTLASLANYVASLAGAAK